MKSKMMAIELWGLWVQVIEGIWYLSLCDMCMSVYMLQIDMD